MPTYTPAPDGWIAVYGEGGAPDYFVRCREDEDGAALVSELLIKGKGRVSAAMLREVPIGRIEATINSVEALRDAALDGAASADPLLDRLENGPVPDYRKPKARRRARSALTRPDRSDPDAFYALVAQAYREYVQQTSQPAVAIAEEAGVPVATARRWVNEARRRKWLGPGQRGRAR